MKNDYVERYNGFFKSIVENEDGTLNKDQVMRELSDYDVLLGNVTKIYHVITNGRISKELTDPDVVISVYEDCVNELIDDTIREHIDDGLLIPTADFIP